MGRVRFRGRDIDRNVVSGSTNYRNASYLEKSGCAVSTYIFLFLLLLNSLAFTNALAVFF